MSVAVDKFNYKLPYKAIFGGVTAISGDIFRYKYRYRYRYRYRSK